MPSFFYALFRHSYEGGAVVKVGNRPPDDCVGVSRLEGRKTFTASSRLSPTLPPSGRQPT